MKHFSCLMPILLPLLSCSRETAPVAANGETSLEITAPQAATKTWIDVREDGLVLPVWWSDGDRVCINGVVSDPIAVSGGEKISKASFKVRNVEAPFTVLYPSSAYAGSDESGLLVNIPSVQDYIPDSFGNGSAIMFGCGDSENGEVQMQQLCGAVCISLKDAGSTLITALSLTALGGAKIAGDFVLALPAGELRNLDGSSTVQMELPEGGVQLSEEVTNFIFTIPAGEYPEGFMLRFDDSNRRVLRRFWLRKVAGGEPGLEVRPGRMVMFGVQEYVPDAREICSGDDWNEFVEAYNLGGWESEWQGKDGVVRIGADFTASSLDLLNEFSGTIDGCGHTITQTRVTEELIGRLSGKLCNLTLAGKFIDFPQSGNVSVFVRELVEGGLIENCRNLTDIDISCAAKIVAAPFVRSLNGGMLRKCVNDGEMKISVDVNSGDHTVVVGGISATSSLTDACAIISECMNNKPVTVTIVKDAASPNRPLYAGYGGILGTLTKSDASHYLTIEGCINNAPVSVGYSVSPSSGNELMSGAGGIIGMAARFNSTGNTVWYSTTSEPSSVNSEDCVCLKIESCVNNGDISNGLVSKCSSDGLIKCYAGGLAGVLNGTSENHIAVTGSSVFGKVIPHEQKYSRSAFSGVSGGLSGFGAYVDFTGCTVRSAQIGTLKRQNYSAAGGIGYVTATFKMKDCKIFADIQHIRVKDYTEDNRALGFSLSTRSKSQGGVWPQLIMINGSSIENCSFGGSIIGNSVVLSSYNGTTPAADQTITVSETDFQNWIASASFYADPAYTSDLTLDSNTYWDGN